MDGDVDIAPGVQRIAAPGHTPGHSFYSVCDGDERVVLVGDATHCPQQLDHVDWCCSFDADPDLATRTRAALRHDLISNGGQALGTHFPGLTPVEPSTEPEGELVDGA